MGLDVILYNLYNKQCFPHVLEQQFLPLQQLHFLLLHLLQVHVLKPKSNNQNES